MFILWFLCGMCFTQGSFFRSGATKVIKSFKTFSLNISPNVAYKAPTTGAKFIIQDNHFVSLAFNTEAGKTDDILCNIDGTQYTVCNLIKGSSDELLESPYKLNNTNRKIQIYNSKDLDVPLCLILAEPQKTTSYLLLVRNPKQQDVDAKNSANNPVYFLMGMYTCEIIELTQELQQIIENVYTDGIIRQYLDYSVSRHWRKLRASGQDDAYYIQIKKTNTT